MKVGWRRLIAYWRRTSCRPSICVLYCVNVL